MGKKYLHGNKAKATDKNIESVYQTNTIVPKEQSKATSHNPVTSVSEENVIVAKKCVDENHM